MHGEKMRLSLQAFVKAGPHSARPYFVAFISIWVLLTTSGANAQDWKDVASFAVHEAAPYFVNESYGFVFTPGIAGPGTAGPTEPNALLWRTTDGGASWQSINTGIQIGDFCRITQLYFVTASHGYMAVDGVARYGLYETLDSGLTWNKTSLFENHSLFSVYVVDSLIFAINRSPTTLLESSDDGLTWQTISGALAPELIIGNSESLLEVGGPGGTPGGFYNVVARQSADYGATWSWGGSEKLGPEAWNQFVFPHSQTIVLAEEFGGGTSNIELSVDGGQNWVSTYATSLIGGINAIAGDGCAVYVQRTAEDSAASFGCLRSTNNGQTWVNVGGPVHECDARTLSVVGHGAVVYAIADSIEGIPINSPGGGCHLWRTTDGGDGLLSSIVRSTVTTGHTLGIGASGGDTLITKLCDTASLSLWLHFMADNCDYGGLSGVSIDGIDSTTAGYTVISTNHLWSQNLPDTAMVTILPQTPGTYPLTVHAHYTDDDFLGGDTTFHLTLIIQPNPGILDLNAKPLYDFGTQALCTPVSVRDTFSTAAHGCEQVTVDSVVFHPDSTQFKDFTFKNSGSFIPDSIPKSFPISFKPSIADTERGNIFIYWFDGETQHVDTIPTQGVGVSDTRTFAIHADTLSLRMCDSTNGTVLFTNTTCGTLTLDSLTLPNGVILAPGMNPLFPLVLAPGASDSLIVHLVLGSAGTAPLQVGDTTLLVIGHVQFTEHGSSSAFDTTIVLSIRVGRGVPAATLSTASLDFGSVSTCGGSVTLPVVLFSTGCDTLTCSSAVPALPFALTKSFSPMLPVGEVDTAFVTFTPTQSGQFNDTLTITTNASTETVPLHGVGIAGASILSVDTAPRYFGALYACQSKDTTITLHNSGCEMLTIKSASLANASFTTDTTFPLTIPPSDSVSIRISLLPNTANTIDTIQFFTDASAGDSTVTIPLSASIIPPAHLVLALSPSDTATDGALVTCYVLLEGQVPSGTISGLTFDITHNDDLLSFESASGVTMTGTSGTPELQVLQFTAGSPAESLTYTDTLGAISFRVYLSDSSFTPLSLSSISFTNSLSLADNCIASIVDSGASFTYVYQCGEPLILDAMLGTLPFTITEIVPNPAQDEITIALSGNVQPFVELFDALGRGQDVRSTSLPSGVSLDVTNLPSGIYFIRLSAGGYVQSRSVVIQK
jgi:Secretion system C-terminal sorting domain